MRRLNLELSEEAYETLEMLRKRMDKTSKAGEERHSRRIARYIVQNRPIATTVELARLVEQALGGKRAKIHPATRTFMALRIAVNSELKNLELALKQTIDLLRPGGRLTVISYHSLEDRIVKQFMRYAASSCQGKRLAILNGAEKVDARIEII